MKRIVLSIFVCAVVASTALYADIPAGYYNLYFEGLGQTEYSIKLKDTLVEIGDGLTTNIVITQNDYALEKNYASILYVNNEGSDSNGGTTLSDPIAFSQLNSELLSEDVLIYLLSDVDFVYDTDTSNRSIEETTRMSIMHGDNSGVDQLEGQRLSLSNTYAINRGVTNLEESGSFAQKASIEIILA
jgi:hypothetical protein